MMTQTTLNNSDLENILTLIDFHEDWDEVKEIWGFDIESLRDKVFSMMEDLNNA